ncbi:MAG: MATE family efflux transporter [Lachnospiraceae bacterium]|nr:MATE family efflux transporter [Lachnospiraceae bacterium]
MQTQEEKKMITDFTEGSVTKQLLVFAAPLFLSNLLQVVYNMADMVIVGQAMGKVGLSAVAVGGDVTNFLTFLAMGFSNAGQVIIAQLIGAEQRERLGRLIGTMFTFLISCALVLSVVCLLFRGGILGLMNTPESSWDQAMVYATVSMVGLVFIYGYNMVSAVLRGMGDSRHPFIFISAAAILNVVLDLLFVLQFQMGAMGAALATIMSQGISFLCCGIFLWYSRERLGFSMRRRDFLRLDGEMLGKLVKLGVPMAIKSASVQFSKLFVNSWINSYGVEVSAVAGVASKFNSISNLISNAVNTAGSSMVGQNIGARKYRRVPQIMRTAFVVTLTTSTVMTVAMLLFPRQIFGIFISEEEVMAVAMEFLPVAILIFYGAACRAPMNTLLNGSGNYRINFVTAILDGIILRIGLSLLFGLALNMEYVGFWLGDALASFTPFWIGLVYYFSGTWKTRKYVIRED